MNLIEANTIIPSSSRASSGIGFVSRGKSDVHIVFSNFYDGEHESIKRSKLGPFLEYCGVDPITGKIPDVNIMYHHTESKKEHNNGDVKGESKEESKIISFGSSEKLYQWLMVKEGYECAEYADEILKVRSASNAKKMTGISVMKRNIHIRRHVYHELLKETKSETKEVKEVKSVEKKKSIKKGGIGKKGKKGNKDGLASLTATEVWLKEKKEELIKSGTVKLYMNIALRLKFNKEANPDLHRLLVSTGTHALYEKVMRGRVGYWNWNPVSCQGGNTLGELLMNIRDEFMIDVHASEMLKTMIDHRIKHASLTSTSTSSTSVSASSTLATCTSSTSVVSVVSPAVPAVPLDSSLDLSLSDKPLAAVVPSDDDNDIKIRKKQDHDAAIIVMKWFVKEMMDSSRNGRMVYSYDGVAHQFDPYTMEFFKGQLGSGSVKDHSINLHYDNLSGDESSLAMIDVGRWIDKWFKFKIPFVDAIGWGTRADRVCKPCYSRCVVYLSQL